MIIKDNQYNAMEIVHYIYWEEVKHLEIELLVIHTFLLEQETLEFIWEMNIKLISQEMAVILGLRSWMECIFMILPKILVLLCL